MSFTKWRQSNVAQSDYLTSPLIVTCRESNLVAYCPEGFKFKRSSCASSNKPKHYLANQTAASINFCFAAVPILAYHRVKGHTRICFGRTTCI